MTKADLNELVILIVSNLNKLLNSTSPKEYFFLVDGIKELLDELIEAKFIEVSEQ